MFKTVTILGGIDKTGSPEPVRELTIERGQVYSIVGFTGSGKSQLISDIEQMAQRDTISKRKILLDGYTPDSSLRYDPERKLVAQLSQNMNFVLDMQVGEFLSLHAECRGFVDVEQRVSDVIACANTFAGEAIKPEYLLTSLSGGQSRSLMIANVAVNSASPIILIDEVENAGIDKLKALESLLNHGKIVLIVTHDPMLALFGARRIMMKNGGIQKTIDLSSEEREVCKSLRQISAMVTSIQDSLRKGQSLDMSCLRGYVKNGGSAVCGED